MHFHLGLRHKTERREEQTGARPVETPYIVALDDITLVAGIVGPFTVLPQIWQIFATHSAQGVSLLSWSLIFIVTLPWVFYGFAHKDRSIIISFILWEVANALVVVGVLMYGG
jgi:MtN3 and saliva related transmembrane protein